MALERVGLGALFTADPKSYIDGVGRARDAQGKFVAGAAKVGPVMRRMSTSVQFSARQIQASFKNIQAGMQRIGGGLRDLAFATAPLGIAIGAGVKQAINFEKQMDAVGAITGVTGAEFAKLQSKAEEMGIVSVFSATESAQAMEFMARAGANADQIIGGLTGVMNAAAAEGIDLATAADIVAQVTKGMNREWEQAGNTADILALASARSNTNITALGESFKFGVTAAQSIGLSLEETTAIFGKLADAGLRGSLGGTAFVNMINRLAKPTSKGAAILEEFGVKLTNADGSFRKISAITNDFSKELKKIPNAAERAAITSEVFGIRGARAFTSLAGQGAASINKLEAELRASSFGIGAAAEMAERRLDNFAGAWKLFASSVEAASIQIFSPLLGTFTETTREITGGLNNILGALKALRGITGRLNLEYDESAKLIGKQASKLLITKGLSKENATLAEKALGFIARQDIAGEQLSRTDKTRRVDATKLLDDLLKQNGKLSRQERQRAIMSAQSAIVIEAGRQREADAIRAQIFEIEELNRIEEEHGTTAKLVAQGIQDGIELIKEAWNSVVESIKAAGKSLEESIGEDRIRSITKIATVMLIVAGAIGPVLLVLFAVKLAIGGIAAIAGGLASVVSAALLPILLVVGGAILLWQALGNEIGLFIAGIREGVGPVIEQLGVVWNEVIGTIREVWNQAIGEIRGETDAAGTDWKQMGLDAILVIGSIAEGILRLIQFIVPAIVPIGKVIADFVLAPFKRVVELVKNLSAAFAFIFEGEFVEGFKRLGAAIVDFILAPIRLLIRTIGTLAEVLNLTVPESLKTLGEEGLTGLFFPEPEETREKAVETVKQAAEAAEPAARKAGLDFGDKTKGPGILDTLKDKLEQLGDLKTKEKAKQQREQRPKVDVKIEDKTKTIVENRVCLDGKDVAINQALHRQELQDRSGFRTQRWQRRVMVEDGAIANRSAAGV